MIDTELSIRNDKAAGQPGATFFLMRSQELA